MKDLERCSEKAKVALKMGKTKDKFWLSKEYPAFSALLLLLTTWAQTIHVELAGISY